MAGELVPAPISTSLQRGEARLAQPSAEVPVIGPTTLLKQSANEIHARFDTAEPLRHSRLQLERFVVQ